MRPDGLLIALLASVLANLVHHAHNAEFLDQYPNMPAWLSPAGVYAAWGAASILGAIGYVLLRRGYRLAGIALPVAAHTPTMNLTIWLEAAAASVLLAVLFRRRIQ